MNPSVALKLLAPTVVALAMPVTVQAQEGSPPAEVTFTKDIAPILQRSCQKCHRPGGVAPMPLVDYDTVRVYGWLMQYRTGIRDRMGAMPPWYVEKDIGIQHFKDDPSLSDEEITAIATWVQNGMPEGDPAELPTPLVFNDAVGWSLGEPDLIVKSQEFLVKSDATDWWGDIKSIPTGLTEDRYVASVEIREINNVKESREWLELWREMQQEYAKLSRRSRHIVSEKSGHYVHHDDPEAVIDAVKGVVERVQDDLMLYRWAARTLTHEWVTRP